MHVWLAGEMTPPPCEWGTMRNNLCNEKGGQVGNKIQWAQVTRAWHPQAQREGWCMHHSFILEGRAFMRTEGRWEFEDSRGRKVCVRLERGGQSWFGNQLFAHLKQPGFKLRLTLINAVLRLFKSSSIYHNFLHINSKLGLSQKQFWLININFRLGWREVHCISGWPPDACAVGWRDDSTIQ